MDRNLDGIYVRIKRNGYENVCLSDMTDEELEEVCKDRTSSWYLSVIKHLCKCLKAIGDELDIWMEQGNEASKEEEKP